MSMSFPYLVPSAWPENIHARNTSSTSIEVSWYRIPQSQIHGRLQGYNISLRKANESEWERNICVSENDLISDIENLWKYTKYVLRIAGFNNIGTGVESPDVTVLTDEDGM